MNMEVFNVGFQLTEHSSMGLQPLPLWLYTDSTRNICELLNLVLMNLDSEPWSRILTSVQTLIDWVILGSVKTYPKLWLTEWSWQSEFFKTVNCEQFVLFKTLSCSNFVWETIQNCANILTDFRSNNAAPSTGFKCWTNFNVEGGQGHSDRTFN